MLFQKLCCNLVFIVEKKNELIFFENWNKKKNHENVSNQGVPFFFFFLKYHLKCKPKKM